AIDQNCRSRSRWCRGFYEKLIARSRYLNSGISCGMTVYNLLFLEHLFLMNKRKKPSQSAINWLGISLLYHTHNSSMKYEK
ncbi:hypothetical protein ACSTEA_15025, partial [Vibrio vulnificus]|uniref:hypothetical protein n=1 Tax=Vibrio vulnificus TaxID=672 RepID=UPI003EDA4C14